MSDFDRLLSLSQKTNSTLIVYDRHGGEHRVILSVDEYEKLTNNQSKSFSSPSHNPFTTPLNETEILRKLNEDIALWHDLKQTDIEADNNQELEDELKEEPPITTQWHKAGDLLRERLGQVVTEPTHQPNFPSYFSAEKTTPAAQAPTTEVTYQPLPVESAPQPIPEIVPSESEATPLSDDEPLFFEEPV